MTHYTLYVVLYGVSIISSCSHSSFCLIRSSASILKSPTLYMLDIKGFLCSLVEMDSQLCLLHAPPQGWLQQHLLRQQATKGWQRRRTWHWNEAQQAKAHCLISECVILHLRGSCISWIIAHMTFTAYWHIAHDSHLEQIHILHIFSCKYSVLCSLSSISDIVIAALSCSRRLWVPSIGTYSLHEQCLCIFCIGLMTFFKALEGMACFGSALHVVCRISC